MLIVVVTMFVVLFSFLAGGLWIGWTLAVTGTILLALFRDIPLDKLVAQYTWNILTTQELLALPLFILMGEILFRTRLSQSLFRGLAPWAALLPGRLLHVNVIGCSIFAAISGSSAATTQVVGRISIAELTKRGSSKDVAVGSLAGAVVLVLVGWALLHSSLFSVRTLNVTGASSLVRDQVVAASGVAKADPLISIDTATAATSVEAIPLVKTAAAL